MREYMLWAFKYPTEALVFEGTIVLVIAGTLAYVFTQMV